MAASPKEQKWNASDSKSFIEQIDRLQLPKRQESRRQIYLGEKIHCYLRNKTKTREVDIIDMSSKGIAVIAPPKQATWLSPSLNLNIDFELGVSDFSIPAHLANISEITLQGKKYERFGIIFDLKHFKDKESFHQSIGQDYVAIKAPIKPLVWCYDPFFFNEVVIFDVQGASAKGLELSYSARCKSLFPNRPLTLQISIPGKNQFTVEVKNSDLQFNSKGSSVHIFVEYLGDHRTFSEAMSQYLVMFGENATPATLRKHSFPIGDLSQAISLSFQNTPLPTGPKQHLIPCDFAPLLSKSQQQAKRPGRHVLAKLGPNLAASFTLSFVDKEEESLILELDNHNIKTGSYPRTVEIIDFLISEHCSMVELLIPLVQNIVRIAVQAQYSFLSLEASRKIKPVLEKIGFKELGSSVRRSRAETEPDHYHLMALDIKRIVLNSHKEIDEGIWKSIYQNIYSFLKRQMKMEMAHREKNSKII